MKPLFPSTYVPPKTLGLPTEDRTGRFRRFALTKDVPSEFLTEDEVIIDCELVPSVGDFVITEARGKLCLCKCTDATMPNVLGTVVERRRSYL